MRVQIITYCFSGSSKHRVLVFRRAEWISNQEAISAAKKLGAGPPCKIDIPMTAPQVLKSPAFIATGELTGLPLLKNLSFTLVNSSVNQTINITHINKEVRLKYNVKKKN